MEIGGIISLKLRKWCGISSNAVLHHFVGADKMVDVKSKRAVSGLIPFFLNRWEWDSFEMALQSEE